MLIPMLLFCSKVVGFVRETAPNLLAERVEKGQGNASNQSPIPIHLDIYTKFSLSSGILWGLCECVGRNYFLQREFLTAMANGNAEQHQRTG